jgi:general secretion pathway protein C
MAPARDGTRPRKHRESNAEPKESFHAMNAASWVEKLPAPDRWRELTLAHGPRIATWVLALALGVQAALIVTDLTSGPPVAAPSATDLGPAPQRAHVNVAAIANNHLFGNAQAQPKAVGDAANAPQTSIPLVLTGIMAADDPQAGLAILGENAASSKVYAVGDTVPGGVKLHSVLSDKVILDRNGSLESLMLPRQAGAGIGMAAAPPPPMPVTENAVVDRMRQLIASEPGVISDIMRPQPVFAQGKQRGYRVYPGRNRQAFIRLGLRPGDLVTAINGTPLDDPARGQEIFGTLGSASEAHVTVMRNGRQQDLTLNMATIAQEAENLVGAGSDGAAQPSDPPPPPQEPDGGRE